MKLTTTRVLNRRNIFSVVSIPWHFCHTFFARLKIRWVHTQVSTVVGHNIKLQELTNDRVSSNPGFDTAYNVKYCLVLLTQYLF